MKTFIDTHGDRSRSFVLYGNLNDTFWCGDLVVRNSDQFLVKLLKSRGYRHIVFYGDAATKGAYTLDPESARFFFGDNRDLPLPDGRDPTEDQEKSAAPPAAGEQPARAPQGGTPSAAPAGGDRPLLASMVRRTQPGQIPQRTPQKTPEAGNTAKAEESPPARRVRYAYQAMELESFMMLIKPLMLDPDSRMAVIFYNIFTSDIGEMQPLRDYILNAWEQTRGWSGRRNLCLLLAPDSMDDPRAVAERLHMLGLSQKFALQEQNGTRSLNRHTCFSMGLPKEDEIANLLRRFRMVGTVKEHRKISFPYPDLMNLVAEIIYCSRSCDARNNDQILGQTSEYMRQIAGRLQTYVESRPGLGKVELDLNTIDEIWGHPPRSREPALERLNRPGWENAYHTVKEAVERCQAYSKRESRAFIPQEEPADWPVRRLETVPPVQAPRPPVPNFILLGHPGVGKTTIARLIGEVLREYGILKIGFTVEVTKENLTSSYVAGTPKATLNCVNRAEEGVLFIDEAHALAGKDGGAYHEPTGLEVISTLNNAITDPNRRFCVIMAGYPSKMKDLYALDQGFFSRFGKQNEIVIDDYGPEQLERILTAAVEENNCTLAPELTAERQYEDVTARPLSCYITRLYQERDREKFGNAREMQDLALTVCGRARNGVVAESCFYGRGVDHEWFVPSDVGCSLDRILTEIQERFVGMDWLEAYFEEKAQTIEEILAVHGSEEDLYLRPILLVGEPGTGKTSVAGMLAKLFYHFHLLGTSEPIIADGSSLASSLAGGSQEKVREYIKSAQDRKALLFVDEVHQLLSDYFDGAGAMKAFLNPLTDRGHPFLLVMAVYPSKRDELLKLDPGISSRFEIVEMPSYTGPQLDQILHRMMARHRPTLRTEAETDKLLRRVCDQIYAARDEDTGNGRRMERLLEEINTLRRKRCRAQGIAANTPEYGMIRPEDVPQYLVDSLPPLDATREQLLEKLDQLVGLEQVKKDVRQMINQAKVNQLRRARNMPTAGASLHMVFRGNPGTGKTTVARLIGQLYHAIGVLPKGHLIEVSRAELVGGFIGQTALKTQDAIDRAKGGVLFIDEAYTLETGDERDFGREAINTFLKQMEDQRDNLVVIVAGYIDEMNRFIAANPGLESRFNKYFDFADYGLDELEEILARMCAQNGYVMTAGAKAGVRRRFQEAMDAVGRGNAFSNGRYVRNLFEKLIGSQADRLAGADDISDEDLQTITVDDLAAL